MLCCPAAPPFLTSEVRSAAAQQCTARRSYERATDDGVWPIPSCNRFAWDGCVVIAYVPRVPCYSGGASRELYSTGRQAAAVVTSDSELRGEGLASRLLMTLQVVVSPPHRLGGVPHGTRVIAP